MALVSHQHGFIYLKTEKTGGTSVEMALQTLCTPTGTEVSHYGPAIVSKVGILGARGDKYTEADVTGWTSHMPAKQVARKLGRGVWSRYLKVASLRNPFDKAVSWYWFMAHKHGLDQSDPVEDFRAFLREKETQGYFRSRKDIDWRVTHIGKRPIIDQYIRLEHLQDDFAALFGRLGIAGVTLDVPKVKAKTRKQDPLDVPDYFDTPTAEIVQRNWGWIFEAGGYSRDPAEAGRASKAAKRRVRAPETVAKIARPGVPESGLAARVKTLLTRRAG
ncbi:MAG TPA: hypothetical protein DIU07_11680 [Rhodobacteraceae bacterium]|nr:hypothetical protein [Paracoccaceae bacterium]